MGLKNVFKHKLENGDTLYVDHDRGKDVPPTKAWIASCEGPDGEIRWMREFATRTGAEAYVGKFTR